MAAVNGETTVKVSPYWVGIEILPGEGVIMGVVVGASLTHVLPPGTGYELLEITYLLNGEKGEVAELTYDCVLDDPPIDTIFVINGGQSVFPTMIPGEIEILPVPVFVRGDGNADGEIDLADPIYNLDYLFGEGPSVCLDAQDTNDDGTVNIADPVYNLTYQFSMGPPPPLPFPDCGPDATADILGCLSYTSCP